LIEWVEFHSLNLLGRQMKQAGVPFYPEFNDFLPSGRRDRATSYTFAVRRSIKDIVEALGVPHTEIDLILANGESVNSSYHVQQDDGGVPSTTSRQISA
jgi:hypothetical protein